MCIELGDATDFNCQLNKSIDLSKSLEKSHTGSLMAK